MGMLVERNVRAAAAVLALIGIGVASYIVISEAGGGSPQCLLGGTGCQTVAQSPYAELAGVNVAAAGIVAYVLLLAAAMVRGDPGRFGGLFVGLVGFGFSFYLTYLELFVIHAVCQWCVASAVLMTLSLAAATARVLAAPAPSPALGDGRPGRQRGRPDCHARYGAVAAVAAIGVVGVLIVVNQARGGGGGNRGGSIQAELRGIPQRATVLGDPRAPAIVVEFGDPQCPVCRDFSRSLAPELISQIVRPGQARYEFRPWVLIGPDSGRASRAALAAGQQNRFWQYISLFYQRQGKENSGYVTRAFLESIARAAGVPDLERWNRDRTSSRWDAVLSANAAEANALGFRGTPSIFVQGPRGRRLLPTFYALGDIEAAIRQVG
jgi:protein-disulfide isomerase